MKHLPAAALRELICEIQAELGHLSLLEAEIEQAQANLAGDLDQAQFYYGTLSLHLHNFYTNCEHIFQRLVAVLEQALAIGPGWRQRLLERMGAAWESQPAVLSPDVLQPMRVFLAYRPFVRDSNTLEPDLPTLKNLLASYPQVWGQVKIDVLYFVDWLRVLTEQLDKDAQPGQSGAPHSLLTNST